MNIGQAIKLCRTQRGFSQTELAQQAECSVSYLSMLENNKRDPTLSTMTKIANALRIPVGIIFFLGAEGDDLTGIDKSLQGELARTALELLNETVYKDKSPI
ncbi:helix-turn-helix domain-containing protein [Arsenophonus apicola]|uniref:Helix-turn-helix transcriptional regulator n=1 Tax=Arsenophonus apicola TaxID=2879119 RepID=A0ABY8P5B9_9GAMM|nr:helix-turn-helix transcriptional regulator [Arsenophonus apicola]WGO84688.1 helix-turn-helix transcriptional regulator [Arsenophonus apicola]